MELIPYYPQENPYTCSLAVLRMVLACEGTYVNEQTLIDKVKNDYGDNFKNLWNPTIAKLACQYKVPTRMYAKWPIFKKGIIEKAFEDYIADPTCFRYKKYENSKDDDTITEPLPLAYSEMFAAYKLGCEVVYGGLTGQRIERFIKQDSLIQTSIKLHKLYPGEKHTFHSILIHSIENKQVIYHDPAHGSNLRTSYDIIIKAATDVGAFMVYDRLGAC